MNWRDYWNQDTPIYAGERHKLLHYGRIANDIVAELKAEVGAIKGRKPCIALVRVAGEHHAVQLGAGRVAGALEAAVRGREPQQRGLLVRRIVVDVQVGVRRPPQLDEFEELHERLTTRCVGRHAEEERQVQPRARPAPRGYVLRQHAGPRR